MSFSLSGLASGLDTNTIISQLMQLERIPYQKLEQKQSTLSSKQSIFRSINTKLNTLRTAAEDLLLKSNFNLRSASNSDESVLKATISDNVAETSFRIHVSQLATQHTIKSEEFEAKATANLSGTFKINGNGNVLEIDLDTLYDGEQLTNEDLLTKVANEINNSNVGVKASIIETKPGFKTLVINSVKFGVENSIKFGERPTGAEDSHIYIESTPLNLNQVEDPKNAIVNINGIQIEASSNELNNVIPGLSLTLHKTGDTTINVTKDLDKITEKVAAFVNAYNDVIDTIKTNTAKGKALQGDPMLRTLQDELHRMFNTKVEGNEKFKYLFQVGLEIDKGITNATSMTGKISFDKDKFKAALAENPDEVFNLFAIDNRSSVDDAESVETDSDTTESLGIARLFRETLMSWTRSGTGILAVRIEGFDSEISFLKKQMDDMNTRLEKKEQQLKNQFIAMESALIQLQNQQAWMASQIASMGYYNY